MTGQSVGSDASPLSCFSSPQAPYRSFPPKRAKTHSFRCVSSSHRTRFAGLRREPCFPPLTAQSAEATSHTAWESPLRSGFKSHSHKRLTFVFTGESGYTLTFANRIAHSGSQGETGAFQRRVQKACGTAMRSCASLSRGVAAPLGCVISWLFLSPHRRASRFWSAASLARRKLSGCSLVTAVRFWDRCLRRSMRGTCPSEQRSGCRF